jgi:hypothetical protein
MQSLFVIYDEAFQQEISAIIERDMVVPRYSRLDGVIGARMAQREEQSGYLADRRNRMIMLVAEPLTIARIVVALKDLRARKGHGLRAFVVPTIEVI